MKIKLLYTFFLVKFALGVGSALTIRVPESYYSIRENLIVHKDEDLKVYHGGPVIRENGGVKWIMPIVFENANFQPRAVYEIAFVNCTPAAAQDAEVIFFEASDIDIKFKNALNENYKVFSQLISGSYKNNPYILVRRSDIAMVVYPSVFIDINGESIKKYTEDKAKILHFLKNRYSTKDSIQDICTSVKNSNLTIDKEDKKSIIFAPIQISIPIDSQNYDFYVTPIFLKNDIWQMYYLISRQKTVKTKQTVSVRIDSGCVSGQIYGDDSCDCLDQLHTFIKKIVTENSNNSLIIHIPTHDGRGYGLAPKAETEIYKNGGKGRINEVEPMDTVSAAKLLYLVNDERYDIRNYDGAAYILKLIGCKTIKLYTDNSRKLKALKSVKLLVKREATHTNKASCLLHIKAKKNDPMYFKG